jgi:uncharacterized membrane protein YwzB
MSGAQAEQILDHPTKYSRQVVANAAYVYSRFVEETVLTVFLWVGLWGVISILIDTYIKEHKHQIAVYLVITIVAFGLLMSRGHIPGSSLSL